MGFLAWIKNGAKGTYGLQMPAFFPASKTTYDNSNSGLSATRVQGAIDEVWERVDGELIASVNSDGVKTIAQILNELVTPTNMAKLTDRSVLVYEWNDGTRFPNPIVVKASGYAYFSRPLANGSALTVVSYRCKGDASTEAYTCSQTSGGFTVQNDTNTVLGAGNTFYLYK